jgi:hypothetical protein
MLCVRSWDFWMVHWPWRQRLPQKAQPSSLALFVILSAVGTALSVVQ